MDNRCARGYNRRRRACNEYRDDGYNRCDDWDSECCDWWPCSWGCKLITWICVAWYWVANLVCIGWSYIEEFVWLLHQDTIMAQPSESPTVRLKDESDIPIVSAAMNAKADVFVTGDQELQNLGQIGTLRVLSPRQFWEKLRTQLGASEDE